MLFRLAVAMILRGGSRGNYREPSGSENLSFPNAESFLAVLMKIRNFGPDQIDPKQLETGYKLKLTTLIV